MKADQLAISNNQDSEIRAARRAGVDAYEIARERMDYEQWVRDERKRRGLPELVQVAETTGPVTIEQDETADKADENA
jgi:hypothetical protein